MNRLFFYFFLLVFSTFVISANSLNLERPILIPNPTSVVYSGKNCKFPDASKWKVAISEKIDSGSYHLVIKNGKVKLTAGDTQGIIHGQQTLQQLRMQYEGRCPEMEINDSPRLKFRSFMLDSGRQYQSIQKIKKIIDLLYLLKFNKFHWHLTEGLGWRIEIKKYPLLAQKGGSVGKGPEQQGYYTQDEIRDIVKYAAERGIEVIPEIDMPGHAEAALSVYPEMSCLGESFEVPQTGFTSHIFCAGKERTILFLKDILNEVCELFPSQYIHIGGDEAPKANWDKCTDCQAKIKKQGLKNSHDLQLYFSATMAEYLKTKGRKAIFWGDVVYEEGYPLPDNAVIHWWNYRGHKDLAFKQAVKRNLPVICGTNNYTYLNFPLTPWMGYAKDRTFDIKDIYTANPSSPVADKTGSLGMSCALWTDYGVTEDMLEERLLPRIFALAEQMWHKGEQLSFDDFYALVVRMQPLLEKEGYKFGEHFKPENKSL